MNEFYIGIDLGGTKVRMLSYDYQEKKFLKFVKKHVVHSEDVQVEMEQNVLCLIDYICESNKPAKLAGIGLAIAALFDRTSGVITEWPNNSLWTGFPIKSYLEQYYKVPVILEDDANAATVGEQLFGAGKGNKSMMYVTVSTGIGCGVIIQDKLITGDHGWAGELGHIKVTEEKVQCTCKATGCLQAVASGPAMLRDFRQTMKKKDTYSDGLVLDDVVQLAYKDNLDAKEIFTKAGKYIGDAIANAVMLFDVPIVVLGGGVMNAGDIIWLPIKNQVEHSLQKKRRVSVICSEMNDRSGVIGALALILRFIYDKEVEYLNISIVPEELVN